MRFSALAAGVLAIVLPACATIDSMVGRNDNDRFEAGLTALRSGDYAAAHENLSWVAQHKSGEEKGRQALLIVSAMELDPRNPGRRLAVGSELAATFMRNQTRPSWTDPVAQTLYLLALELGAADEKVAQAEAEKQAAERQAERQAEEVQRALPKLPQSTATVTARINDLKGDKERLAKKVEQLEAQVADREKKLAETTKELERIKKTLKGG